jgi:phosphatidylglycerophosphate synthase
MSETGTGTPTRVAGKSVPASSALGQFVLASALLIVPVVGIAAGLTGTAAGVGIGVAAFVLLAFFSGRALKLYYPHDRLGLGNLVTLTRTAIIAALFAPLTQPGLLSDNENLAWVVLGLAIVALCLDGVDGFFARRQGLTSEFGARYDMEVDSVFALLLAVLAFSSGKAGLWILVLGGMRYGFVAAGFILPWLNNALPMRFSRKVICVIQIGVLIVLLAPIVSGPISLLLAVTGTALLTYSFGRDIVWLAKHRQ